MTVHIYGAVGLKVRAVSVGDATPDSVRTVPGNTVEL